MTFTEPATWTVDNAHQVSVQLRGRPRSRLWRWLSGTTSRDIAARFSTIGGSLAWASLTSPLRCHVLFTGRPDEHGRCVTQTFCLLPRPLGLRSIHALGVFAALLHDDRRVLDGIDFRPAFAETDAPLRAFAGVVDRLGAW
jgi:hypothetical protein